MKKLFRITDAGTGYIMRTGTIHVQTKDGHMLPLPEYAFGERMAQMIRQGFYLLGIVLVVTPYPSYDISRVLLAFGNYCRDANADAEYIRHMRANIQETHFKKEMKQDDERTNG